MSVYVIAEIGINHNGSIENALELIDVAVNAGCDAVKFQKRSPNDCVPEEQKPVERDTPWGRMSYLDYRFKVEFDHEQYSTIDRYCRDRKIDWFASPWDEPSVEFLSDFDLPYIKIASASLTDDALLRRVRLTGTPVVLSTGMSTYEEIDKAVNTLGDSLALLFHTTSTYPCPPEQLNLKVINSLQERYNLPIGYSGHEVGLSTTVAAVALGAVAVERHITLDRASWGSDQAASVEPEGLKRLVRDIRNVETALGDGEKRVYADELPMRAKLRRVR